MNFSLLDILLSFIFRLSFTGGMWILFIIFFVLYFYSSISDIKFQLEIKEKPNFMPPLFIIALYAILTIFSKDKFSICAMIISAILLICVTIYVFVFEKFSVSKDEPQKRKKRKNKKKRAKKEKENLLDIDKVKRFSGKKSDKMIDENKDSEKKTDE